MCELLGAVTILFLDLGDENVGVYDNELKYIFVFQVLLYHVMYLTISKI